MLNVVNALGFVLFPLARVRALDKSLLFFTVTSVTLLWQGVDFQMEKNLFSKCYGFDARNVEDGAKHRFSRCFSCLLFAENVRLFPKNVRCFLENVRLFTENVPHFVEKVPIFAEKVD